MLSPVAVVREGGKLWCENENIMPFLTDLELHGEFFQNCITERKRRLYCSIKQHKKLVTTSATQSKVDFWKIKIPKKSVVYVMFKRKLIN